MNHVSLEKAIKLSDSGQIEDALKELEAKSEATHDSKEEAFLVLGEITCYLMLERVDQAHRALRRVEHLAVHDADVRLLLDYQRACILIAQGKMDAGLQKFSFVLREHGRVSQDISLRYLYEDIQQRRAFALVNRGRFVNALPILQECVSFSFDKQKDKQLVLLYLGTCHYELGQYALAKDRLEELIRYGLNNKLETEACYRLAAVHFREGALAQAKLRLEEVVCSFQTAAEPAISRRDVYELLSKTCKFLGEVENANHYSKLAET